MLLYKMIHPCEPFDDRSKFDGYTRSGTMWQVGVPQRVNSTQEPALCGPSVIHAYPSVLMAILVGPFHGYFVDRDLLFKAEGNPVIESQTKVGCRTLTIIERIQKPAVASRLVRRQFRVNVALDLLRATLRPSVFLANPNAFLDALERYLRGEMQSLSGVEYLRPVDRSLVMTLMEFGKGPIYGETVVAGAIETYLDMAKPDIDLEAVAQKAFEKALTD